SARLPATKRRNAPVSVRSLPAPRPRTRPSRPRVSSTLTLPSPLRPPPGLRSVPAMSHASTDPAQLHIAASNIRRFYELRFITHLQLWMPIWILYLQDSRGLSLTQILVLDACFEVMMLCAEVPTG